MSLGRGFENGSTSVEVRHTDSWRIHDVWDLRPAETDLFTSAHFSYDGQFLAGSLTDGSVHILDVPSWRPARFAVRRDLMANRLAWIPGTHTVCLGGMDGRVYFWNVDTDQVESLAPGAGVVWQVAVTPDAKTLAVGTQDGVVKLFNLATRREISVLSGHLTMLQDLAFSPDGQFMISVSGDSSRVWKAAGW